MTLEQEKNDLECSDVLAATISLTFLCYPFKAVTYFSWKTLEGKLKFRKDSFIKIMWDFSVDKLSRTDVCNVAY